MTQNKKPLVIFLTSEIDFESVKVSGVFPKLNGNSMNSGNRINH